MSRLRLVLLALLACCAGPRGPAPGPTGEASGVWREQSHWIPVQTDEGRVLLDARICRPLGDAPARVAVINHGAPPLLSARLVMAPQRCEGEVARWFLDRGFLVVFALRRGYGGTGGSYAETSGPCAAPDYVGSGRVTAQDIAAVVDYATALPYARPDGAVVVGQSAGGWGTVAYDSLPHPKVAALISMAGGRGGWAGGRPGRNCRPDLLALAAGRFGASAGTPMLWVFAANDTFFPPPIAAAMAQAFTAAGGRLDFETVGPFDGDGHALFWGRGGSAVWGPLFERYLAERGALGG
ncbi:MAG: prolyl oligopeptidase family serine peptidase [Acidisphaera sp.]|nr:prolyl oligopeptidase family serine peptidase [Acidisphaera sp.]